MVLQRIKVGIIGTNFGGQTHVPAFQNSPHAQVVAICGQDIAKTKKIARQYNISYATTNYRDLLNRGEIDLVTISTPPETHYRLTMDAIKKKKHVLCEKPFGLNDREAKEMYEAAKKAGIIHLVSHQMRFQLQRMAVQNILMGGDLGRILHVNLTYSTSNRVDPDLPWTWWSDRKKGGGELFAMGGHQIDLLRWWFGEVQSVQGKLRTLTPKRKDLKTGQMRKVTSDDLSAFQMNFKSGLSASCVISSVAIGWKGPQIQIYGDKGSLFIDGEQNLSMIRKTTATHDLSVKDPLLTESWVSGSEWRASFARMAEDFLLAIKESRPIKGATFYDGLMTQKVMKAIRRSDKEKRLIKIS